MYLIILNGKQEGQYFELAAGTYEIGRSDDAHVTVTGDKFVSGKHAELVLNGDDGMIIRDIGSRNGTYVLGERVQHESVLACGDIFHTGRTFFKVTEHAPEHTFAGSEHTEERTEAIVVVDIVGSSKIANLMGDRVASKVKSLLALKIKEMNRRFPADFIKSTGDGFMLVFAKPIPAILMSLDLLRSIVEDITGNGILLRIGINFGETMVLPDGDRRGAAVDMAFRVEALKTEDMHQTVAGIQKDAMPRTNRIFITEAMHRFVGSSASIRTRCIGFFDLKGFTGRHKIFEVMQ